MESDLTVADTLQGPIADQRQTGADRIFLPEDEIEEIVEAFELRGACKEKL